MRAAALTRALGGSLLLAVSACGGTARRAAMPDVASTDASADQLGLPAVRGEESETSSGGGEDPGAPVGEPAVPPASP